MEDCEAIEEASSILLKDILSFRTPGRLPFVYVNSILVFILCGNDWEETIGRVSLVTIVLDFGVPFIEELVALEYDIEFFAVVDDELDDAIKPIPESSEVDATEAADIPLLFFINLVDTELEVEAFEKSIDLRDEIDNDLVPETRLFIFDLSSSLISWLP